MTSSKTFQKNAREYALEPNPKFSPSLSANQSLDREQAIPSLAKVHSRKEGRAGSTKQKQTNKQTRNLKKLQSLNCADLFMVVRCCQVHYEQTYELKLKIVKRLKSYDKL